MLFSKSAWRLLGTNGRNVSTCRDNAYIGDHPTGLGQKLMKTTGGDTSKFGTFSLSLFSCRQHHARLCFLYWLSRVNAIKYPFCFLFIFYVRPHYQILSDSFFLLITWLAMNAVTSGGRKTFHTYYFGLLSPGAGHDVGDAVSCSNSGFTQKTLQLKINVIKHSKIWYNHILQGQYMIVNLVVSMWVHTIKHSKFEMLKTQIIYLSYLIFFYKSKYRKESREHYCLLCPIVFCEVN